MPEGNFPCPKCAKSKTIHWKHNPDALKHFWVEADNLTPERYPKDAFVYALMGVDSVHLMPPGVEDAIASLVERQVVFWASLHLVREFGPPTNSIQLYVQGRLPTPTAGVKRALKTTRKGQAELTGGQR